MPVLSALSLRSPRGYSSGGPAMRAMPRISHRSPDGRDVMAIVARRRYPRERRALSSRGSRTGAAQSPGAGGADRYFLNRIPSPHDPVAPPSERVSQPAALWIPRLPIKTNKTASLGHQTTAFLEPDRAMSLLAGRAQCPARAVVREWRAGCSSKKHLAVARATGSDAGRASPWYRAPRRDPRPCRAIRVAPDALYLGRMPMTPSACRCRRHGRFRRGGPYPLRNPCPGRRPFSQPTRPPDSVQPNYCSNTSQRIRVLRKVVDPPMARGDQSFVDERTAQRNARTPRRHPKSRACRVAVPALGPANRPLQFAEAPDRAYRAFACLTAVLRQPSKQVR